MTENGLYVVYASKLSEAHAAVENGLPQVLHSDIPLEALAVAGVFAQGEPVQLELDADEQLQRALAMVPFVDVIHTMLDESLPLTVGEFEEWGNPKIREQYEYMKSYCPYTNLGERAYPAILVKTSLNDSQVMYREPAKYVAKMRALNAGAPATLFKINLDGGHGGASGRYDYLREIAFDYAWVLEVFLPVRKV